MNLNFNDYRAVIQNMGLAVQTRARIAAISIGYAAGCHQPLPSAEVANPVEHYATNCERAVRIQVSQFNEATVLDAQLACDMARKFWMLRYEAVHKCPRMDQIPGDFFCSIFGVANFFSADEVAFMNEHSNLISRVYVVSCRTLEQIETDVM